MIFQHTWKQVIDGTKKQTRRLVKPGEGFNAFPSGWIKDVRVYPDLPLPHSMIGKIKWAVGRTYAVQPGRGQKSVGRIRITGIRQERVQDITFDDAVAEGITYSDDLFGRGVLIPGYIVSVDPPRFSVTAKGGYQQLWDSIHTRPGETWAENPSVWVLEFELVR